ncbi:response regulator transcription factor [Aquibacillus albus]|uniref:Two-component system response regulator YesN n=1 Tax=Aquibacillus albus TaxID=1168171 RepID=A0ABS2MYP4_9BACI|nr:response regulator [Aquibacillus albus]MBM7571025.1 two-component system response regulator YesN [Aquibacillus albus]
MYNVLLVDDERMILEGISSIINWEEQKTNLAGTARNGLEAFDFIHEYQPDIVITDITMPGLDGIELLEKAHASFPEIKWIFLSGYNEFEYAQKAMRYGVKHYLLKPCNEDTLTSAISDVVREIDEQNAENHYVKTIENKVDKFSLIEREQLLKAMLTNRAADLEIKDGFLQLVGNNKKVQLLYFYFEGNFLLEQTEMLRTIVSNTLHEESVITQTNFGDSFLVLIRNYTEDKQLLNEIKSIQKYYLNSDRKGVSVIISKAVSPLSIYETYREVYKQIDQRFYLGEQSVIFSTDSISFETDDSALYQYDPERMVLLLKSDKKKEVITELEQIFKKINEMKLRPNLVKSYLIHLYMTIVKIGSFDRQDTYMREIARLEEIETLPAFRDAFEELFLYMIDYYSQKRGNKYSPAVTDMLRAIEENLEDPMLSLQWVATERLYMNADYLGKLFKKEVGEKFSTYVTRARIQRAVKIIEQEEDVKVFELAERLGFGTNSQYFSQIFKRITGVTPSDIMKSI